MAAEAVEENPVVGQVLGHFDQMQLAPGI